MTQKLALITGGSRGLGYALATALAEQGWSLIINGRDQKQLAEAHQQLTAKTDVTAIAGDVTDADHRNKLAAAVKAKGQLDVLVNNASTLGQSPLPHLLDFPLDTLETVFRTNVIAPLAMFQAVYPYLHDGARIINLTSDAGVEAYEGWGGYGASKAALEHLSAILAEEHPTIKIYWVDPGDMQTQMHQDAFPNEDISDRPLPDVSVPGFLELITGDHPSGRYAAQTFGHANSNVDEPVTELRVVIPAEDYDSVKQLYTDGLGLLDVGGWDDPNGRGRVLEAGKAVIEIIDMPQAKRLEDIEAVNGTPPAIRLAFRIENLPETAAQLSAQGATAIREAINTPWGHYSQRFTAPQNQSITLFQDQSKTEG